DAVLNLEPIDRVVLFLVAHLIGHLIHQVNANRFELSRLGIEKLFLARIPVVADVADFAHGLQGTGVRDRRSCLQLRSIWGVLTSKRIERGTGRQAGQVGYDTWAVGGRLRRRRLRAASVGACDYG